MANAGMPRQRHRARAQSRLLRCFLSVLATAAVAYLCARVKTFESAGAALVMLLVLFAAAWLGSAWDVIVSLATAAVCLTLFFFDPLFGLGIRNPADQLAMAAFVVTATCVSALILRYRRTAAALADSTRHEAELARLHLLGLMLLRSVPRAHSWTHQLSMLFDFDGLVFYEAKSGELYRAGRRPAAIENDALRRASESENIVRSQGSVLLRVGSDHQRVGALCISGCAVSDSTLRSISRLLAAALSENAPAGSAAVSGQAACPS